MINQNFLKKTQKSKKWSFICIGFLFLLFNLVIIASQFSMIEENYTQITEYYATQSLITPNNQIIDEIFLKAEESEYQQNFLWYQNPRTDYNISMSNESSNLILWSTTFYTDNFTNLNNALLIENTNNRMIGRYPENENEVIASYTFLQSIPNSSFDLMDSFVPIEIMVDNNPLLIVGYYIFDFNSEIVHSLFEYSFPYLEYNPWVGEWVESDHIFNLYNDDALSRCLIGNFPLNLNTTQYDYSIMTYYLFDTEFKSLEEQSNLWVEGNLDWQDNIKFNSFEGIKVKIVQINQYYLILKVILNLFLLLILTSLYFLFLEYRKKRDLGYIHTNLILGINHDKSANFLKQNEIKMFLFTFIGISGVLTLFSYVFHQHYLKNINYAGIGDVFLNFISGPILILLFSYFGNYLLFRRYMKSILPKKFEFVSRKSRLRSKKYAKIRHILLNVMLLGLLGIICIPFFMPIDWFLTEDFAWSVFLRYNRNTASTFLVLAYYLTLIFLPLYLIKIILPILKKVQNSLYFSKFNGSTALLNKLIKPSWSTSKIILIILFLYLSSLSFSVYNLASSNSLIHVKSAEIEFGPELKCSIYSDWNYTGEFVINDPDLTNYIESSSTIKFRNIQIESSKINNPSFFGDIIHTISSRDSIFCNFSELMNTVDIDYIRSETTLILDDLSLNESEIDNNTIVPVLVSPSLYNKYYFELQDILNITVAGIEFRVKITNVLNYFPGLDLTNEIVIFPSLLEEKIPNNSTFLKNSEVFLKLTPLGLQEKLQVISLLSETYFQEFCDVSTSNAENIGNDSVFYSLEFHHLLKWILFLSTFLIGIFFGIDYVNTKKVRNHLFTQGTDRKKTILFIMKRYFVFYLIILLLLFVISVVFSYLAFKLQILIDVFGINFINPLRTDLGHFSSDGSNSYFPRVFSLDSVFLTYYLYSILFFGVGTLLLLKLKEKQ